VYGNVHISVSIEHSMVYCYGDSVEIFTPYHTCDVHLLYVCRKNDNKLIVFKRVKPPPPIKLKVNFLQKIMGVWQCVE
jgi:hypothetical protein